MASNVPPGPSNKRWPGFYDALQLAIQQAAHKWTFEEFAECFPLWCEEQPKGAETVYQTVSGFVEKRIVEESNTLFENYALQENLDRLQAVVDDARRRKRSGEPRPLNAWREDLEPRAATCARTIPTLEAERDKLRKQLTELEAHNTELEATLKESVDTKVVADEKIAEIFAFLDELVMKWKDLPVEEMQEWSLQKAESQSTINPSL
ncbi:hypothetical protein FA95DRAFT_1344364 [Auriscalpium vulgare]|uniref:Uncharacterized protein n=1 Tax=Auriscalpium vulgare TaxID=40419 RepID=A0ACB8RSL3_9AGAM|nr:hypothetical protein FA95DRAFT_1344364 [Auriscalpium vulgare]